MSRQYSKLFCEVATSGKSSTERLLVSGTILLVSACKYMRSPWHKMPSISVCVHGERMSLTFRQITFSTWIKCQSPLMPLIPSLLIQAELRVPVSTTGHEQRKSDTNTAMQSSVSQDGGFLCEFPVVFYG